MAYQPTIRRPTGIATAPLIMVSGLPKSGKSTLAYLLGQSQIIHRSWVIDLGEGSADEYGTDDSGYEVVEWGRSFADLKDTIRFLIAEPCPPKLMNVITIDSGTELWDSLKDRASSRARRSKKNAAALETDPDYEVDVSMPFWNDAKDTWAGIISPLKLAPHIVGIVTVATDMVAEVVNGVPTNRKVTSYQCEKTLTRVVTAHVAVRPDHTSHLIEVRSKLISVGVNGLPLKSDNPLDELLQMLSPSGDFSAPEAVELQDDERGGPVADTISPEQKQQLFDTVKSIESDDTFQAAVKTAFTRQFGLLADLPLSRFDEAVKWLGDRLSRFDDELVCNVCGAPLAVNMHANCGTTTKPKRGKNKAQPPETPADELPGDDMPVQATLADLIGTHADQLDDEEALADVGATS